LSRKIFFMWEKKAAGGINGSVEVAVVIYPDTAEGREWTI